MTEIVTALLGGTAALAIPAILAFLFREWIVVRLRQAVAFEYQTKFQELQHDQALILEKIREDRAERELLRSLAIKSLAETQAGTLAHRLKALDVLWKSFLELTSKTPPILWAIDTVGYRQDLFGPKIFEWARNTDFLEAITPLVDNAKQVAEVRPYIGDYLYNLFSTQVLANTRATAVTLTSLKDGKLEHWFQDEGVTRRLSEVLSEREFTDFAQQSVGQLAWLRKILEEKIVVRISHEVSGQFGAAENIKRSGEIYRASWPIDGLGQ